MLAAAALALAAGAASAADFTLSGDFTQDDQVALWILRLDTASTVTVTSLGYGGGVDTRGQTHAGGGFDTMLFLFGADGVLLRQSDDGTDAATDPVTGLKADAGFTQVALAAGNYTLALTQYDNTPSTFSLSDGFSQAGSGNFTPSLSTTCTASSFCDWSGAARTGHWVLAITGVAAVPEPGAWALMLGGLAGIAGLRRRSPARA